MQSARYYHCSCIIQSDNGTPDSIIVIGGFTNEGISNTTEIFIIREKKWIQGPTFPFKISDAACASLPPTTSFACAVVGGWTDKEEPSSDVYGLNRSLTSWKYLGKIKKGKFRHIVLPLS